jgi:hypothetical protein
MDKLLEMLGIQKLDEAAQTEIKEKLALIIEVKAKELSAEVLVEEKEKLVEDYEKKFDEYKDEITSKFSDFVDSIFEEELTIPEKVLEFASKGELYHDLIEQFKVRLSVDEGLLDEEVKALLKEAKEEIINLRTDMNKTIDENLTVKSDAQEMAAQLYLYEKCDGLTDEQKKKVFTILEGIKDKDEIDKKFTIVLEQDDDDDDDDDDDKDKKKKKKKNPFDKKKSDDDDDDDDDSKDEGKGKVDADGNPINEDDSPFKQHLEVYKKVLQENKVT